MLHGYILQNDVFTETMDISAAQWINVESSSTEELKNYASKLNVSKEFMLAASDPHERSICRKDDDQILVVIRASYVRSGKHQTPFTTIPIAFLLTPEKIITISNKKGLSKSLAAPAYLTNKAWSPVRMLLVMLLRICKNYIEHIHQIDMATQNLESSLQESMQNKELIDLMHAERALIYLITSLKTNQNMLEKLEKQSAFHLSEEEKEFYDNVIIENTQAIGMADVYSQVLGNIGDTFGAIISNNLNQAMKFLTAMTIVLMIPTIVVGTYGMNVPLPFADHPGAFSLIFLICVLASALVWFMFAKKQWM